MLGLPKTTEFNRRIPKQKFYENLSITPALRRSFIDEVRGIYWRNKLAATTLNLAAGSSVTEIEVFEIQLNARSIDEAVLRQIDREIPYHILFLLSYENQYQAWIGYKEAAASGNQAFKVSQYYHTEWLDEARLPLQLDGLNLDTVYENFVRQIRNSVESEVWRVELSVSENVALDQKRQQLEKQITALEKKIRREKQFNKQVEMNAELKRLKKELEELLFI
ncbi:MAG: DUF4391 domain-containing protein [Clostridia bacterium]|nr:DUF4391 domain-containing protein [Clostridia bacterium]